MSDPHDDAGSRPDLREQLRIRRDGLRDEFEQHVAHARDQFEEANERIKQRTGRDLILAILIGAGLVVILVGSLIFIKWLFAPIAFIGVLLVTFEFSRALRASGRKIDAVPQLLGAALIMTAAYFAPSWVFWASLFISLLIVIAWRLVGQMAEADGRTYGDVLADVLASGLIQVYIPFLASMTLVLLNKEGGQWWILGFIIVVVCADTGAYASGLTFGKHAMAPRISPKKTWEGLAGAIIVSIIAATLVAMFMLDLPWWAGTIFGLVIVATATLGDLTESMIKRDLGIKDMSSWLPGHGGMLDRLDSILPSAAAALFLYHVLPVWTGA